MKTTRLYVRLKPEEKARIKELAGNNISAFVLDKIFKDVTMSVINDLPKPEEYLKEGEPSGKKCMHNGCRETDTYHKYIDGCRAYFCVNHYAR